LHFPGCRRFLTRQVLTSSPCIRWLAEGLSNYNLRANTTKQYILCGEFLSQEKNEWIPFATVQTSAYEQWIGHQSVAFCQGPKLKWAFLPDLSAALKRQLDSLPKR
jgi:hypothetical protein